MNNTEPKGKLAFAYKTIARLEEQKSRILTAANVSSVDEIISKIERYKPLESQVVELLGVAKCKNVLEVVALLERKRDPQGFLINTDIDDTMSKPLSDEDIEQAAKDYVVDNIFDSSHISDAKSFIAGANFANSPQAGWVDVKDVKDFLFMMSERHEDKLCFDIADIIKFTSQPLPPKPKQ